MKTVFATPLGTFAVEADEDAVTRLHFPGFIPTDFHPDRRPAGLLKTTELEILEYIAGKRKTFNIPMKPHGTGFTLKVWDGLCRLGYGEVVTYGHVASVVGSPGAARAVGMACRINPIPLLIPCHRVIGANGKLTGFYGGGLNLKQTLIEMEAKENGLFGHAQAERRGPILADEGIRA